MYEKLKTVDHGTNKINLTHLAALRSLGYELDESRITEMHIKQDGSILNEPSLAIVSVIARKQFVVSQISIETLKQALSELGYSLEKRT